MKQGNIIQEKSFQFAIAIVKLCQVLQNEKNEYILSRQLTKSGTSIWANIEETIGSYSKKEFLSKITIAYKEARESHYWLRLLHESWYISDAAYSTLLSQCEELLKIIASIQKTIKKQLTQDYSDISN